MQFKDIYGQDDIKANLIRSVKENRVAHAQMFCARKGSQSLAMALAYAQYCNCKNRSDEDSCGVCSSCIKMNTLTHPDVHFVYPIVKKSGGKDTLCVDFIDDWRDMLLNEYPFGLEAWIKRIGTENSQGVIYASESEEILRKLSTQSFEAAYNVVIIWMPEKMHPACANKLLKLIEEPESKSLFLLVSDSPDEVLGTITSRTQMVRLHSLSTDDVRQYLKAHNPGMDEQEVADVARVANGDLVLAKEVMDSASDTQKFFELFAELMRSSYLRNAKRMKLWSDSMVDIGRKQQISFLQYAQRMIRESFVRNLHLESELNYMTKQEMDFTSKFAPFVNERNIVGLMNELQDASRDIEQNTQAKLVFFDLALRIIMLIKQ